MSAPQHPLTNWFNIVLESLRREDRFLREHLLRYSAGAYGGWNPGIGCLYETGIVYLMLRELWAANYPQAIGWEFPYPDCPQLRLDIAIFDLGPDQQVQGIVPQHAIEVKKKSFGCNFAEQQSVWWDILKVLSFRDTSHRYVLLLTFGRHGSPLDSDVRDLLEMRVGRGRHQSPDFSSFLREIVCPESQQYLPFYQARFHSVEEVLFDEFDTALAGQPECGRVRVSLIEVR